MTRRSSPGDGPELVWVSERHLLCALAERSSPESWRRVRSVVAAIREGAIEGVIDVTPAYTTVIVEFDLDGLDAERVTQRLQQAVVAAGDRPIPPGNLVDVPTCYEPDFAPDIEVVAALHRRTAREIAAAHASVEYEACFIGFQPGFAYLGGLPAWLNTPRLDRPRTRVPAGSVGIAGDQTGVYPFASAGGWRLVGRTPLRVFDADRPRPALIQMGDRVRFVPISARESADIESSEGGSATRTDAAAGAPAFRVVDPGMLATVQDLGRPGMASLGIPRGGAADPKSLVRANLAVGNSAGAAGIELTLIGATLEAMADVRVAVSGGLTGVNVNERGAPLGSPIEVKRGELLKIGPVKQGCRTYLAVAGGIEVAERLGSASTNVLASFGGFEGRPLRRGDVLHARRIIASHCAPALTPPQLESGPLRVVVRPDGEAGILTTLLASEFRVSASSDRVGVRLDGPAMESSGGGRMTSQGMMVGAIQIPPDGRPIILGCEHPTTGGYPVAACIIAADAHRIGQLRPGESVSFERVTIEEARRLSLLI